jgi:hypothetical protein
LVIDEVTTSTPPSRTLTVAVTAPRTQLLATHVVGGWSLVAQAGQDCENPAVAGVLGEKWP